MIDPNTPVWQLTVGEFTELMTSLTVKEKVESVEVEMVSFKDAVSYLNVSKETLHRWNRIHYLDKRLVGGKPFYRKSDLIAVKTGTVINQ